MTYTHFLLVWVAYLVAATGCVLSLWLITGRLPLRLQRALRCGLIALLFTPCWLTEESMLFSPAFLTAIYDGLTHGTEAVARAGVIAVSVMGAFLLFGIALPVRAQTAVSGKNARANKKSREASSARAKRQEPTLKAQ